MFCDFPFFKVFFTHLLMLFKCHMDNHIDMVGAVTLEGEKHIFLGSQWKISRYGKFFTKKIYLRTSFASKITNSPIKLFFSGVIHVAFLVTLRHVSRCCDKRTLVPVNFKSYNLFILHHCFFRVYNKLSFVFIEVLPGAKHGRLYLFHMVD